MTKGWHKSDLYVVIGAIFAWLLTMYASYKFSAPDPPYFLTVLPIAVAGCYLALRNFEQFVFLMVTLVPMSAFIPDLGGGIGAALPAEAMLLIAFAGFALLLISGKLNVPSAFLRHPLSIAIFFQTLWILVSATASTHLSISIKFLLARIIYLLVFFVGFGVITLRNQQYGRFFRSYLLGLFPITIYAIVVLAQIGFGRSYSPVMAEPFFDDHTLLGVCLSMLLPVTWLLFKANDLSIRIFTRINLRWVILLLVPLTLFLSYSRAAWLSLGLIFCFYWLIQFRVRFVSLMALLFLLLGIAWWNQDAIIARMDQNRDVSGASVAETVSSVTNLSSDDSNLERINRWACAVRMAEEKPFLGFGPGTYEREYGVFQVIHQRTRISTMRGDLGDAHSEYLGALSEQGIPGMIMLIAVFLTSIWTGLRVTYDKSNPQNAALATAIVLGLSTYIMHGFVNDFLDIDKAATIFWAMLGILVAMDVGRMGKQRSQLLDSMNK